jgi:hypothetical protein
MNTSEETAESTQSTGLSVTLPENVTGAIPKRDENEARNTEKPEKKQAFKAALRDNLDSDTPKEKRSFDSSEKVETKVKIPTAKSSEVAESPKIIPPADMRPDERDAFTKADPKLQGYLSRRALEIRQQLSTQGEQLAGKGREYAQLDSVVTPEVRQNLARMNLSVPTLVENSLAWHSAMKTNPVAAAQEWLEAHGLTPEELITARNGQAPQPKEQPKYLTAEEAQRIADERFEARMRERDERESQRQGLDTIATTVNSWVKSKPAFSDPGTAAQLEAAMAPRIERLRALDPNMSEVEALEEAYQHTISKDPQFSALNSQLTAKPTIETAKRASRSIHGGPGSGSPKQKYDNFRENLNANLGD